MTFGCSWQIPLQVTSIIGDSPARRKANLKVKQQILPTLPFINLVSTLPLLLLPLLHKGRLLPFVLFNGFAHFAHTVTHLKQRTPPDFSRRFVHR